MYKFFEYCFYRIAITKYYQKVDPKTPYVWAFGCISFCELANVLTLISIFCLLTNNSIHNIKLTVIIAAIPIYIINLFVMTGKKYKKLVEYYKDEKNKILKDWGVFLYVSVSILVFPCIRIIFF